MNETVLTEEIRDAVVRDIVELARDNYVLPDVGREIADHIQSRLDGGAYAAITDGYHLAETLTADLRAVSDDRHWNVMYSPEQANAYVEVETEEDDSQLARWLAQQRRNNFGFEKVERLRGNIGYIDLRMFAPSEYAGETAVAAMSFVANCDALIFDLRQNRGGSPTMVQLLTSYLLDPDPIHINTFHFRKDDRIQQFWTFPHVPGKRMPDVPIFVLTSGATGSGAEEFVYNLKHMERATLVGETTVGAAHPVNLEVVRGCFRVLLPFGRPINPISNANWEKTGVEPHVAVPQEDALETAHLLAFDRLLEACADDEQKQALEWEAEIARSVYTPVTVGEDALSRVAGHYGERTFAVEEGSLRYNHALLPATWTLVPITETSFRLNDDITFAFNLDDQRASTVTIRYRDGRPETTVARTNS